MKTTVNFSAFCDAFRAMDRNENFSYPAKKALFEYLEAYEEDTGEEIELDVIALCCDYQEMSIEDIAREYRVAFEPEDDLAEVVLEYLNDNTTVIDVIGDDVLFANF